MKSYRIYQIDAFTKTRFLGNPAGVVANADGLSEQQMQALARELNNAETAFILAPTSDDHDVQVRFFTPTTEVPTCGHATIAAHYVRAIENNLPSCTVMQRIGIGILPVDIIKEESDYRIIMTQGTPEVSRTLSYAQSTAILDALNITEADRDPRCPIQIASTGHSKVMIGIKHRATLNALEPNLMELTHLSARINCNGYFVFTFDSDDADILTHGRMFAPAIGIPEDPVTGNANGPLGAYLIHNHLLDDSGGTITFHGQQGEAIGRTGVVCVDIDIKAGKPHKVKVGGYATIAFKTEIQL